MVNIPWDIEEIIGVDVQLPGKLSASVRNAITRIRLRPTMENDLLFGIGAERYKKNRVFFD